MNGKFKIFAEGAKKEVFIDDFNLGRFTTDLKLELTPHSIPVLKLELQIMNKIEINGEGIILIDNKTIPPKIAKEIYLKLKEHFEK